MCTQKSKAKNLPRTSPVGFQNLYFKNMQVHASTAPKKTRLPLVLSSLAKPTERFRVAGVVAHQAPRSLMLTSAVLSPFPCHQGTHASFILKQDARSLQRVYHLLHTVSAGYRELIRPTGLAACGLKSWRRMRKRNRPGRLRPCRRDMLERSGRNTAMGRGRCLRLSILDGRRVRT